MVLMSLSLSKYNILVTSDRDIRGQAFSVQAAVSSLKGEIKLPNEI